MTLFFILLMVGVVLIWPIVIYNLLVRLRNQLENAWAQIDVQLKRRYELIPNLVETVKGYAAHERQTFEAVTQARKLALAAQTVPARADAERSVTVALQTLLAVAEAYPDLRANQNFLQLQEELASTENKIAFARQFYNDSVMVYNTRIQTFPTLLVAKPFDFGRHDFFQLAATAEREAPKVGF